MACGLLTYALNKRAKTLRSDFTILIADRNPRVRDLLKRELMEEGYQILAAQNDREVLELVTGAGAPALLVLDLAIPYANGIDLVMSLKDKRPDLPIIIHTLYPEYEWRSLAGAVDAFLQKKGNIDGLKKTIRSVLDKRYPE